jgi:hypothetical protein
MSWVRTYGGRLIPSVHIINPNIKIRSLRSIYYVLIMFLSYPIDRNTMYYTYDVCVDSFPFFYSHLVIDLLCDKLRSRLHRLVDAIRPSTHFSSMRAILGSRDV